MMRIETHIEHNQNVCADIVPHLPPIVLDDVLAFWHVESEVWYYNETTLDYMLCPNNEGMYDLLCACVRAHIVCIHNSPSRTRSQWHMCMRACV